MSRGRKRLGLLGAFRRLAGRSVLVAAVVGAVAARLVVLLTYDAPRGGPVDYFPAIAGAVAGWLANQSATRAVGAGALAAVLALVPIWLLSPGFARFGVLESLADRGPLFAAGLGGAFAACLGGIGAYVALAVTGESPNHGGDASPRHRTGGDDARDDD
jgi:hypothetical protein